MRDLLRLAFAAPFVFAATSAVARDLNGSPWSHHRRQAPPSTVAKRGSSSSSSSPIPVDTVYGVNIGNWLIMEPWMSPSEWISMQGEFCANGDCSTCRQSEWSLASYLGQEQTNKVFQQHWQTWFQQSDVDNIVAANLNTVRVPMGFWIIEDLVDRPTEPYAEGALDELIRGLNMFKNAGIHVILDQHALPGVSSSDQMFAGNCTTDVKFYSSPNDYNYKRAVTWSIVMTWLIHTHPAFSTVFALEAINEPIQDATQTPGLGRYETAFVIGVRAIELALGVPGANVTLPVLLNDTIAFPAFQAAIPIIAKLSAKYNIGPFSTVNINTALSAILNLNVGGVSLQANVNASVAGTLSAFCGSQGWQQKPITTQFMNRDWQYNGPSNPAAAARGPQFYDGHLYLNFGGVAPEATEDSYLQTICTSTRVQDAIAVGNGPIVFGEWSLAVAFNTTNAFLKQYGDAQKLLYSSGGGWLFWNWKIDQDAQTYPIAGDYLQWTYMDALSAGLFTSNPADVFDEDVCDPYV